MNAPPAHAFATDSALRLDPRPKSAVSTMTGLTGLAGLFAWTALSRAWGMEGPLAALCALLACGVPMVLWSVLVDKVHRNPSNGIDWDGPPRPLREIADISLAKIVGLWGIWALIGFLYCVGRFYWSGPYLFSMQVLGLAVVPMLVLSIPYVLWLDRRLREPKDGAWHFGQLLIGRGDRADRAEVHHFLRAWAVKGFFTAFMFSILPGNWWDAIRGDWAVIASSPVELAFWLIKIMFMVDVTFATVGYVLTMKPLDAHIRTANTYAAGWTAALLCYPPFIMMGDGGALDYHVGTAGADAWTFWLDGYPLLTAIWGGWLVFLTGVYAWATVAFGIRFSNLTHRGILTHGPYAWTKHPAYLSKNLFWICAVMPFLAPTGNPVDMIRNTVLIGFVAGVYYWRARTEERHLSADPAYVEYAEWMARNGPIPRLIDKLKPRWSRPAEPVAAE
jgi:protein-S-isoprenylcysteine O-methyltransferase Ste14